MEMKNPMGFMPALKIGDLAARLPIIQGGMGVGVSGVCLASAVANEGGIGVLSSAGMGVDVPGYRADPIGISIQTLKGEIRKARELTNGILGVNIMVATSNFTDMAKAAIEEKIDLIFAGAGLPLDLPKYLIEGAKTKLVPIVSSARAAATILKRWTSKYRYIPDAFVVEGPLAGGHLGFKKEQLNDADYSLESIIPQVIETVQIYETSYGKTIPVIAAGGIYTGGDIYDFLKLGAAGVQMGTRFVTTTVYDVAVEFKESYLNCSEEDIMIIDSPVGLPGRAIRNGFLESLGSGTLHPVSCPYHCIRTSDAAKSPYCIALALLNAKKGRMEHGFAFAGQNAYRAERIMSVHELMQTITEEYDESCRSDYLLTAGALNQKSKGMPYAKN